MIPTSNTDTNTAATETPQPPELAGVSADRVTEVDVRPDLRAGNEPFNRIMAAKAALPANGVLKLRAIFEPTPLYAVFGKQGFKHWTECLAADDWVVWFYRPEGADASDDAAGAAMEEEGCGGCAGHAAIAPAADPDVEADVVVLDVRGLEPPEPMVRTLAALDALPRGHTLVQINSREPRHLLPQLRERGFQYEVREQASDLVRVFIRHAERVLDVRVIPPREKHPAIFETFGALGVGESFVLVNDHDPKPLRYQFEFEHADQFGWEYLEEGPVVWRVEISRVA
jgi:uncharacterized protein (DUF2249 family)